MTDFQGDMEVPAVVLADVLDIRFSYTDERPTFQYNRHKRIKILKESGYEYGDIVIPFISYASAEEILGLKAQVILPSGKKIKVDKSEIREVSRNSYVSEYRFAFPNLQPGCVVEYEYTIRSFLMEYIDEFYFQSEIPTLVAELFFEYPYELMDFNPIKKGRMDIGEAEVSDYRNSYTVNHEIMEMGLVGFGNNASADRQKESFNLAMKSLLFQMKDVPAIKPEPFVASIQDQYARISFQQTRFRENGIWKPNERRWYDLARSVSAMHFIGGQSRRKNNARELLGDKLEMYASAADKEAILPEIYTQVKSKLNWNGQFSWIPDPDLNIAIERGSGNSAVLNLALINALHNCGIETWPVFLSTRKNGKMQPEYPYLLQFDHLIAYARIGQREFLMDLTGDAHALTQLPVHSMNGLAWLAHTSHQRWLPIEAPPEKQEYMITAELANDGKLKGSMLFRINGYRATTAYFKMQQEDQKTVFDKWFKKDKEPEFGEAKLEYDFVMGELKGTVPFSISSVGQRSETHWYIDAVLLELLDENPFKLEERKLPVELPYPYQVRYNLQLTVPDGYTLETEAANQMFRLATNGGEARFVSSELGNKLNYGIDFSLNQLRFEPDQYSQLKEYYKLSVEKAREPAVLVKDQ